MFASDLYENGNDAEKEENGCKYPPKPVEIDFTAIYVTKFPVLTATATLAVAVINAMFTITHVGSLKRIIVVEIDLATNKLVSRHLAEIFFTHELTIQSQNLFF